MFSHPHWVLGGKGALETQFMVTTPTRNFRLAPGSASISIEHTPIVIQHTVFCSMLFVRINNALEA